MRIYAKLNVLQIFLILQKDSDISACPYMRVHVPICESKGCGTLNFKQSLLQAHAPICEYITHHHILAHVLLSEGIRYIEKNI